MIKPEPALDTHAEDLLADLADDFLRRHRAGERPSIEEYAGKHPELAERIRDLFPAVVAMEQPGANATLDPTPPTERVGAVIGRYKLLERIGEGGFGVVYMAEQQQPVRRRVALKVIKPGLDTRQVIARFEAERQALALMDHENIAKVLDAGATDAGRPYFVMELVYGVPITDYCDKNHLTPRERLELFVQVCRAVQHAHTKGIIHRDIKPTNVLVTLQEGVPVPKIIDFGIAKATGQQLTDKTLFTHFAQMVGTPLYMSPEQAEMTGIDVDTRSDVYSLGVLLYELLTGTTPVDKDRLKRAACDEVRRIIRDEDPPRPSTRLSSLGEHARRSISARRKSDPRRLSQLFRGELDWIVMKALEKDRKCRYEAANSFAQDIQRYLADEPVLACPPSTFYRAKKFVRRHKGPVLAAAIVALALLMGMAGTTWGLVRAEEARQAATTRAEGERKARQDAEEARRAEAARAEGERLAKQEAQQREAETRAVLEFLQYRVLAAARPEGQAGGLGQDVTLRQAIEAAVPYVESSFADRPLIEGRLRLTLADSFLYLGEARIALEQAEAARALYTRHRGPADPDTIRSMSTMAEGYAALGQSDTALKLFEEALDRARATFGPDHPNTLNLMGNVASALGALGRHSDAIRLLEQVWERGKAVRGAEHPDTLADMLNLAVEYSAAGRREDALKLNEELLVIQKAKLGPDHPDTLHTMANLATVYGYLDRKDEALRLREQTLELQREKLGDAHPYTLATMNNLALSYGGAGRHADAAAVLEEALALQRAKLGPEHPLTIQILWNLAAAYFHLGRHADAAKLQEEALAIQRAHFAPDDPNTIGLMNNLAATYSRLGRPADAQRLREEAAALQNAAAQPATRPAR